MNDFIPASIANGLFDVSGLETRNPCGIARVIGDKAAGDFKPFISITLPLALPSIAVAGLIAFLMAYSEFTLGWLFVDKADNVTLAMSIYAMVQSQYSGGAQPWSYLGSLAIVMSIPVVAIFLIFQRALLERMMFGAVGDS